MELDAISIEFVYMTLIIHDALLVLGYFIHVLLNDTKKK